MDDCECCGAPMIPAKEQPYPGESPVYWVATCDCDEDDGSDYPGYSSDRERFCSD